MAVDASKSAQLQELHALLAATLLPPGGHQKEASERLRSAETSGDFLYLLFQLLQGANALVRAEVRQASAIYLKNYVRRRWPLDPQHGGIQQSDRVLLLQTIVPVALSAERAVRLQCCATMEEIVSVGSLQESAPELLPQILEHLMRSTTDDLQVRSAVVELLASVTKRLHRDVPKDTLIDEVSHSVATFGPAHLQILRTSTHVILSQQLCTEIRQAHLHIISVSLEIFQDLSNVAVVGFIKDHLDDYISILVALLDLLGHDHLRGEAKLSELLVQICDILYVYAFSHKDDFQAFATLSVRAVGKMLVVACPVEGLDELIASGMRFLSMVAAKPWACPLFDDESTLRAICEQIVLPSVALRPADVDNFWNEPREFLRLELDGAEHEGRRRAAVELVQSLRRFHDAQVSAILVPYVSRLLQQASTAEEAEKCKDASVSLVIALAGSAMVHSEGCTTVHAKSDIASDFLIGQVLPELNAEPLSDRVKVKAACLRFVHAFRSKLPADQLLPTLQMMVKYLNCDSPVVHTYAALCISSFASLQHGSGKDRRPRLDVETIRPLLTTVADAATLKMLSAGGLSHNEYLARSLMTILASLGSGSNSAELMAICLPRLVNLIQLGSDSSANPEYMHCLFECAALCAPALLPTHSSLVYDHLLGVIGQVLEKESAELLPYSFQLLGLLVDLSDAPAPQFVALFPRLMHEAFWQSSSNILGLRRLFRAYFQKHEMYSAVIQNNIHMFFELLCLLLRNQKLELLTFSLFNSMLEHLPCGFYQECLPAFFSVVLNRLESRGSKEFEKELVFSTSLLAHKYPDVRVIPGMMDKLQPGIFALFMERVWLPCADRFWIAQRKKICAFGISKVMLSQETHSNDHLLQLCCESLVTLLGLCRITSGKCWIGQRSTASTKEEDYTDYDYKVRFNRLVHAELPGTEVSPVGDLAPEIKGADAVRAFIKDILAPLKPRIQQLGEAVTPLLQIL